MKYFNGSDFCNIPVSSNRPKFYYSMPNSECIPVVSIVTPYYNPGAVFRETFDCILNQSLQQWQWVIVNDGSTDDASIKLLDEIRDNGDSRIKIINHGINKGLSSARNTGYRNACASLVMQLDSDDLLEATALEKLVWSLMTRPESSFVSSYTVGFGDMHYLWTRGFHEGKEFLKDNLVTANCLIRREVFTAIGGFDESRRQGLEDWDFWLRCANAGFWGHTVHEFLEWYRRRESHADRWAEFAEEGIVAFRQNIHRKYHNLKLKGFPKINDSVKNSISDGRLPFTNNLNKNNNRILLILPWLVMGGADHFNLSLVRELVNRGYELTIATTVPGEDGWCHEFACYTSDIFMLHRFLELKDFPRFLRYLIDSRKPDSVIISNSELGYLLLPYLRSHCPTPIYLDYCHMEEIEWRQGGFPSLSIQYRQYLDATMVASQYLKQWMLERGGDDERIHVCRINVDADLWRPDLELRQSQRDELGIHKDTIVILYAARLCRQKLPLFFAEIIRELSIKNSESIVALVVGDGEDGPALARFIKKNRLQNCLRLLGKLSIDQMRKLMTAADIFLLPSQNEGISLALYEAMATGLAVVAADVGGQKELVAEGTGILLSAGGDSTVKKLYVQVLDRLINEAGERDKLGRAARTRIKNYFLLKYMVDNFEQILGYAVINKRSVTEIENAEIIATNAVQYLKAFDKVSEPLARIDIPVMVRGYAFLTRLLGPLYFWCLSKRFNWVISMKDLIRKRMGVDKL